MLLLTIVACLLALGRFLYLVFAFTHPRITMTKAEREAERDSLHGYAPRSFTAPASKGFEKRKKELAAVVKLTPKDRS